MRGATMKIIPLQLVMYHRNNNEAPKLTKALKSITSRTFCLTNICKLVYFSQSLNVNIGVAT